MLRSNKDPYLPAAQRYYRHWALGDKELASLVGSLRSRTGRAITRGGPT